MVSSNYHPSDRCSGEFSDPFFSPLYELSFSASCSQSSSFRFNPPTVSSPSLTPLSVTLARSPQSTEIAAALSPFPATLTSFVRPKPFVCHSYKKTRGWGAGLLSTGVSAESVNGARSCDPRCSAKPFTIRTYAKPARKSFGMNTSKTQHLNSFRIRTYAKTGRGDSQ
jgi:hypothetical protein